MQPSTNPQSIYARERRHRITAMQRASGIVDKRYGKRPGTLSISDNVRTWRHKHVDLARLQYRWYKGMHRSYVFQLAWPLILAHYGGKCLNPSCKGKSLHVCADHVIPLTLYIADTVNCLANLQPLCRSCNTIKREQSIDYRPDHGSWIVATFPLSREKLHR